MDVSNFKELIEKLTSVKEALIEKDPFKALADSAISLSSAEKELRDAEDNLNKIRSGKGAVTNIVEKNGKLVAADSFRS
jgi:Tfp pilus assembly protein PilX